MYYIHISPYSLVIPPPLIPPIPPVFTSCSKARGGLLEAPYIPSAPFILLIVRGPRFAPLANWSRLTDPCFFLPFHPGHFGRWTASSCLCASGKTLAWLGAPYHTWHFLFPLISPLWTPSPLISSLWISSLWGRSPGHTMHPRSLYRSHKPLPFLMYVYQVGSLPSFTEPHALCASYRPCRDLMFRLWYPYFILFITRFCHRLAQDVSLGVFFAPLHVSFTPLFVFKINLLLLSTDGYSIYSIKCF